MRGRVLRLLQVVGPLALVCAPVLAAKAQDVAAETAVQPPQAAPILLIDQEQLFQRSLYGQSLRKQLGEKTLAAEAESRRIDAELEQEERDLTDKRAAMTPEDFAPLAAAFDKKVQGLRAERDAAAESLRRQEAEGRRAFFAAAAQVIGDYMVERGAVAVMDKSAIIVSLVNLDVTGEVVSRIDAVLGDGSDAATQTP